MRNEPPQSVAWAAGRMRAATAAAASPAEPPDEFSVFQGCRGGPKRPVTVCAVTPASADATLPTPSDARSTNAGPTRLLGQYYDNL